MIDWFLAASVTVAVGVPLLVDRLFFPRKVRR